MLQSLIPSGENEKIRFQILVEVNSTTNLYIRPMAMRATSGQKNWELLDPTRFASICTTQTLELLPGLFHITPLCNLANIVANGIQPGYKVRAGGRMDVHFSPFPPEDPRNYIMQNKMWSIGNTDENWVVIIVDSFKCPRGSLRFCEANSIILSMETIASSAFTGIWRFTFAGQAGMRKEWIFEPRVENYQDIMTVEASGDYNYNIAALLATDDDGIAQIKAECDANIEVKVANYKLARAVPVSDAERVGRSGIPLRRCPRCLKATAAQMTYCLACNAIFMGRPLGKHRQHGTKMTFHSQHVNP
jgi:hypothetical protein